MKDKKINLFGLDWFKTDEQLPEYYKKIFMIDEELMYMSTGYYIKEFEVERKNWYGKKIKINFPDRFSAVIPANKSIDESSLAEFHSVRLLNKPYYWAYFQLK